MARILTIPTASVSNAMAAYTIGFARLEVADRVEDAVGAGSGTLVSVGKVRGILTAAHVLQPPGQGAVDRRAGEGITTGGRSRWRTPQNRASWHAFRPDGPDLGFLRLAGDTVGWFEAIGSFYNLLKHRSNASQPAPSQHSTDAIVGMIDERTKDLPAERPRERRMGFEALFSNGTISAERDVGGYDLFAFAPTDYPNFKLPGDYQGTSGGAVWRIYLKVNGEKPEIAGARLWGVRTIRRGRRAVTFWPVAMAGVYGVLLDASRKWPEETSEGENGLSEPERNVNAPDDLWARTNRRSHVRLDHARFAIAIDPGSAALRWPSLAVSLDADCP